MTDFAANRLKDNLQRVRERIAAAAARAHRSDDITLVAVTKYVDEGVIRRLYDLGVRDFGESRPQAIWRRAPALPADARWHMIGHWQTNKVKRTLPLITLAHSIDRDSLAEAIDVECDRLGRRLSVLLEVKLTSDEEKHGYLPEELIDHIVFLTGLKGIDIKGLMAMASLSEDPETSRSVFRELRMLRDRLAAQHPAGAQFEYLSMGMSQDFEVAVEEGATHVRVGSVLFEGLA